MLLERPDGNHLLLTGSFEHGWLFIAGAGQEGVDRQGALFAVKSGKAFVQRAQHKGQALQLVRRWGLEVVVNLIRQGAEQGLDRGGCCQILQYRSGHGKGGAQGLQFIKGHEQQAVLAEVRQAARVEYLDKQLLFLG